MEGAYSYRPLQDPDNIRILTLQPAVNLTDPIICTLEEVRPDDASYTALSYSWAMEDDNLMHDEKGLHVMDCGSGPTCAPGDVSLTKPFTLDGIDVLVGHNLHDALRRLRERYKQPGFRLWVDAICINQKDDLEKSTQVSMMASIYQGADRVVAWLGEGDEFFNATANLFFQCLLAEPEGGFSLDDSNHSWWRKYRYFTEPRATCVVCRQNCASAATLPSIPHTSRWERVHEAYRGWTDASKTSGTGDSLPMALYRAWHRPKGPGMNEKYTPYDAVRQLSRRRYFTRCWVVQEVTVPLADRVVFSWGAYQLAGNPLDMQRGSIITKNTFSNVSSEASPSKNPSPPPDSYPDWGLEKWLDYCSEKECSDPRDRLYAVLGCVRPAISIRPDYRRNLQQVYGEVARHLLMKRDIYALLYNSCGRRGERPADLPTWMPDLRSYFKSVSDKTVELLWDYANPSISDDDMILSCHLQYVGTVRASRSSPIRGKLNTVWWNNHDADPSSSTDNDEEPPSKLVGEYDFDPTFQHGDILCQTSSDCGGESLIHLELPLRLRPVVSGGGGGGRSWWEIVGTWNCDFFVDERSDDRAYGMGRKSGERRFYRIL